MSTADYIALAAGVSGVAFGVRWYLELWRWAKQCQNARIVVGHKKRVQIDASLTDWLSWANQLKDSQRENGRIVYRNGYVAVAIMRPTITVTKRTRVTNVFRAIRNVRKRRAVEAPA